MKLKTSPILYEVDVETSFDQNKVTNPRNKPVPGVYYLTVNSRLPHWSCEYYNIKEGLKRSMGWIWRWLWHWGVRHRWNGFRVKVWVWECVAHCGYFGWYRWSLPRFKVT